MLPKTIGLRNDLRTVVLRRCLFFMLAFTSQSDVVNPAMTYDMPLLCLTMSARAKLRCRGADSVVSFKKSFIVCNIIGHCTKKPIKCTTMAYLGKALFLAGFDSQ